MIADDAMTIVINQNLAEATFTPNCDFGVVTTEPTPQTGTSYLPPSAVNVRLKIGGLCCAIHA